MTENEIRRAAENQLSRREQRAGSVTNREAWLQAAMRSIRKDHPEPTPSAQSAMIERHEAARRALPPPATAEEVAARRTWFAEMKRVLA